MTLNMAAFTPALKQYYSPTRVENMVYKDHPFMAMLSKDENFYGKNMPLPIIYGNPQGRSASFARAKANKGGSKLKDFLLTRSKDYSLASIDNETAEASENDKGAFLKALTLEINGAIQSATTSCATSLFRDGSGYVGQIGVIDDDVIDLLNIDDVVHFEVGMFVNFAAAKSTGALRDNGDTLEVIAVDRQAGKVTFAADVSTITGAAANDFIFVDGDRNAKVTGLEGWLPLAAPTSGDNFFGVDRSSDVTRLGGLRVDGRSVPLEEALIETGAILGREGGSPDVCFVNYRRWSELQKALGSKVEYSVTTAFNRADIGFTGIALKHNKGIVNVVADPYCPYDRGYMLTMNTWKLYSLKKAIRILDLDGLEMLRENDADAVELRVGGYSQLGCNAPGWNSVIRFS